MAPRGTLTGRCKVCAHPERGRIDWLAATGSSLAPLAEQFGLTKDSVWRHYQNHVSDRFKNAAKVGPLADEDALRSLCAKEGVSVLENLLSLQAMVGSRVAIAHEGGNDHALNLLAGRLLDILDRKARLTKELVPGPSSVSYHAHFGANRFDELGAALLQFAKAHPEVRHDLAPVLRVFLSPEPLDQGLIDVTPRETAHAA
jgi:hypothetical protein